MCDVGVNPKPNVDQLISLAGVIFTALRARTAARRDDDAPLGRTAPDGARTRHDFVVVADSDGVSAARGRTRDMCRGAFDRAERARNGRRARAGVRRVARRGKTWRAPTQCAMGRFEGDTCGVLATTTGTARRRRATVVVLANARSR
jgi:hypothetical protein